MLEAITTLLVLQAVGEIISYSLKLPVPGPVLGMVLLLVALIVRPQLVDKLRGTALALLQHLGLLFVPAGVGVMLHLKRIGAEWWPIAVALVVSTALAIVVTALVIHWSARWLVRRSGG